MVPQILQILMSNWPYKPEHGFKSCVMLVKKKEREGGRERERERER